jgi:hypothetical protein
MVYFLDRKLELSVRDFSVDTYENFMFFEDRLTTPMEESFSLLGGSSLSFLFDGVATRQWKLSFSLATPIFLLSLQRTARHANGREFLSFGQSDSLGGQNE